MVETMALTYSELGGDDHLVTVSTLFHPLAKPLLRLLILVVVGCVDEVASSFDKGVKQSKRLLLVHAAHEFRPGISD